jgi:hypothetical protein
LLIVVAVVTAGLAVLCLGGAGVAVFLLRPQAHSTVTLPRVRVSVSPEVSPPSPAPPARPAPLEADRVFQGRGGKVVVLSAMADGVHLVVMTHQGSGGFAVNGLDRGGHIAALLGHGYGKYQGTMLLDGMARPAALQVRASGAWKVVVRDARRAAVWAGKGSGKGSSVLRVERAWTQPLAAVRYTHRGTSNFVIRSYDSQSWDLLVNEIGRQDGETTLPLGTRYIEIEADGAWSLIGP